MLGLHRINRQQHRIQSINMSLYVESGKCVCNLKVNDPKCLSTTYTHTTKHNKCKQTRTHTHFERICVVFGTCIPCGHRITITYHKLQLLLKRLLILYAFINVDQVLGLTA